MPVKEEKAALRKRIWDYMEKNDIAMFPRPVHGRIPNFVGAGDAAKRAAELPEWKAAQIIIANPDSPQRPLRQAALEHGKLLIMASPRLKAGYLALEPEKIKGHEGAASTIAGAFKYGKKLDSELPKPDLIITGCVAVDKRFYRIGKGGGYGDREITAIHQKFGPVPVLTTIHDCQLVEKLPIEPHDTKVDIVVTPTKVLRAK